MAKKKEEVVEEEQAGEAADVEEDDELAGLRDQLEQANAQAAEYLDGWQRAQAEFANYKKRQQAERAQMAAWANMEMLRKLLPVVDDFERALATLPDDLRKLTWCEGVLLIKQKLDAIFQAEGVTPIETEGKEFDPRFHEAVTYEQVSGYDDGQIIGEAQKGYMMGERVLRPALVRVARSPSPAPDDGDQAAEEEERDSKDS